MFSEQSAAYIIKEILLAINHCHSQKICHRDLKPENILLDADNRVKVVDFGTAASLEKDIRGFIGTVYYVAPEVVLEKEAYDEKCDIWSIGVILYMLLTGQPPFNARNEQEILIKISKGVYSKERKQPFNNTLKH